MNCHLISRNLLALSQTLTMSGKQYLKRKEEMNKF